jgi:hypothetical protein
MAITNAVLHGQFYHCDYLEFKYVMDHDFAQDFFRVLADTLQALHTSWDAPTPPKMKVWSYDDAPNGKRKYKLTLWGFSSQLVCQYGLLPLSQGKLTRVDLRTEIPDYTSARAKADFDALYACPKVGTVVIRKSPPRHKSNQRDHGGAGWGINSRAAGRYFTAYEQGQEGHVFEMRIQKAVLKRLVEKMEFEGLSEGADRWTMVLARVGEAGLAEYERLSNLAGVSPVVPVAGDLDADWWPVVPHEPGPADPVEGEGEWTPGEVSAWDDYYAEVSKEDAKSPPS